MDTAVTAVENVVMAALEDAGYMHSTIGQVRKSIKWLVVLPRKRIAFIPLGGCGIRSHDDESAHRAVQHRVSGGN